MVAITPFLVFTPDYGLHGDGEWARLEPGSVWRGEESGYRMAPQEGRIGALGGEANVGSPPRVTWHPIRLERYRRP